MAEALAARNQEAITNNLAHVDFLSLLIEDELTRRRDRLLDRRIKQARLPQLKTLQTFDWTFNLTIPKALILDLAAAVRCASVTTSAQSLSAVVRPVDVVLDRGSVPRLAPIFAPGSRPLAD